MYQKYFETERLNFTLRNLHEYLRPVRKKSERLQNFNNCLRSKYFTVKAAA